MRKRSISQKLKGLWSDKSTSKVSRSDVIHGVGCQLTPYLPVEILALIIEHVLFPIFIPNSDETGDDTVFALQNLKTLSIVSRSFHTAVITACSSLAAASEVLPRSERVIKTSTYKPMLAGYRMLHEPILPLYILTALVDLDFTSASSSSSSVSSPSNSDSTICNNNDDDDEEYHSDAEGETAIITEVTFKFWDPILLHTLLLIWNRQAQLSYNYPDIPKSNIILKIEGADTIKGFAEDAVLHTAFSKLKILEFESIYLRLPEVSFPVRTAYMLEGSMRGQVRRCKVEQKEGDVCAYYGF